MSSTQEKRWRSEAEFFDRFATVAATTLGPFPRQTMQRYALGSSRRRFNKEFRFRLFQDLKGKQVLDLGCGDGTNSVLLAQRGASVIGVDLSQKSIALAKERAKINHVESQTSFHCSPIELFELPENSIDVIWGDGILHHVLPQLELVLEKLLSWAKPNALVIFSEPICLNKTLRRLRRKVPIHTDATPDERPINQSELALIRRYFPELKMRHFQFLGFLDRLLLIQNSYESTPVHRKSMSNFLHWVDYGLLSTPGVRRLGAMVVLHGAVSKTRDPVLLATGTC